MVDFDSVIDVGTYEDFKDNVLAVVYLERPIQLKLVSFPIVAKRQVIDRQWAVEIQQDLGGFFDHDLMHAFTRPVNEDLYGRVLIHAS